MSQSIDEGKNSRRNFSALDKIKKSKKSNVIKQEKKIKEDHFNIDKVFNNDTKYVPPATTLNTIVPIEEESTVLIKEEVIANKVVNKKNENKEEFFNTASILTPNSMQELENIQQFNSFPTKELDLEVKMETRTSAAIAKDRLRGDVLGARKTVKTSSINSEYKRTITANDNLNQMLGSSQVQPVEIYFDKKSNIEKNEVVIPKKSVFIPWEKAPDEDKRKARKIMKAGVASTLLALTYLTFH